MLAVSAARMTSATAIHNAVRTLCWRSHPPDELSCSKAVPVVIPINRTTLVS
jgi:hypothetical protein